VEMRQFSASGPQPPKPDRKKTYPHRLAVPAFDPARRGRFGLAQVGWSACQEKRPQREEERAAEAVPDRPAPRRWAHPTVPRFFFGQWFPAHGLNSIKARVLACFDTWPKLDLQVGKTGKPGSP
jgi:hypothetical protein